MIYLPPFITMAFMITVGVFIIVLNLNKNKL